MRGAGVGLWRYGRGVGGCADMGLRLLVAGDDVVLS